MATRAILKFFYHDTKRADGHRAHIAWTAHRGDGDLSRALSHRQSAWRHPRVLHAYRRLSRRRAPPQRIKNLTLCNCDPGHLYAFWPVRPELFRDLVAGIKD